MPTKKPTQTVGMEAGDAVYCQHPERGALVVRVLSVGVDGFQGEDEAGERHKIHHAAFLGHKRRVKHTYTVADQGEEGTLLEDESGTRRFIKGKPPTPPEGEMARNNGGQFSTVHSQHLKIDPRGVLTKALAPLPAGLALLLKAGDAAVRPMAQSEKPAVAKPSKKPDDDEKEGPALHKHGDRIAFRHGDVVGQGVIVGSGVDGVLVLDDEGREHPVRHDAILPEHPAVPKPEKDVGKTLQE